jgi:hypothetical protein
MVYRGRILADERDLEVLRLARIDPVKYVEFWSTNIPCANRFA